MFFVFGIIHFQRRYFLTGAWCIGLGVLEVKILGVSHTVATALVHE